MKGGVCSEEVEVGKQLCLLLPPDFNMEDGCIFCNVIEFFWQTKVTKTERGGPFGTLKTLDGIHSTLFSRMCNWSGRSQTEKAFGNCNFLLGPH
jgi:hypothetical protein